MNPKDEVRRTKYETRQRARLLSSFVLRTSCFVLLLFLAGCRNCDKVETELRAREDDVRVLREQLDQSECHNKALVGELAARSGLPGPDGVLRPPSEPYPVRSLVLGRGTSGRPAENMPGDDALQVQLEPRDPEGQAIKAPGSLTVELLEVNAEGLKRLITVWQIPPDRLRHSWRNGFFNTGYFLTLPWKVWPSTEKLRVVARFHTMDGRTFEAERDITIRLAPAAYRKVQPAPAPPAPGPAPAPKPAEGLPVLPPPKPASPETKEPPGSDKVLPPPIPLPPKEEEDGPSLTAAPRGAVQVMRPVPLKREAP